jgi:hypothetical protein
MSAATGAEDTSGAGSAKTSMGTAGIGAAGSGVECGWSAAGSTVFNIGGGSAGMGSVTTTTGAGFDFAGAGSGLLALLPLPGFGAGFPEGWASGESSLESPDFVSDFGSAFGSAFGPEFGSDFGPEFGPGFGPGFGDDARVADFIALSQAGWKDCPASLLCCPMRAEREPGVAGAGTPLVAIDIRTRHGNARRAPKEVVTYRHVRGNYGT